ncbi:hypothetical protein AURDEDRAFT_165741 [Auricularia subglabra TFB-10046 SS5]|nr:hypothetical protein AURDEDRAFT_165741 [Auricularia subglabra TFB-10046 SS5]
MTYKCTTIATPVIHRAFRGFFKSCWDLPSFGRPPSPSFESMSAVTNLTHLCAVYFCTSGSQVRRIRLEDARPGLPVSVPQQLFASDDIYRSRVWVYDAAGCTKKFVVLFTMERGSGVNERLIVDKVLVFAVSLDEKEYLCLSSIRTARFIMEG